MGSLFSTLSVQRKINMQKITMNIVFVIKRVNNNNDSLLVISITDDTLVVLQLKNKEQNKTKQTIVPGVSKLLKMIQRLMLDLWSVESQLSHFCKIINKCIVSLMSKH